VIGRDIGQLAARALGIGEHGWLLVPPDGVPAAAQSAVEELSLVG
jgi:hypothetical protein